MRYPVFLIPLLTAARLAAQCPDGSPPPCNRARPRPAAPVLSVAILDFQNLSHDTSDAYLADGVAEEVAERLVRVQRLTVVSRTAVERLPNASTMPTSDLGRALNVSFLVTGSVRRAGGRVRVGVALLRAATGVQGWADQYDRDQGDLLEMQDEIASSVASEITGRLLPAESHALERRPAPNPGAYDAYLKGLAVLKVHPVAGHSEALPWFARAVSLDSSFADAWGMIGLCDALIHDLTAPATDTVIIQGRAAADRAITLAPEGSIGHVALGFVLYRAGYDYAGAEREFRLAIAHDPNSRDAYSGLATIYKRQGRWEESIAARMRAITLDPLDPAQPGEMAVVMQYRHRWAETQAWMERVELLAPGESLTVRYFRIADLLLEGRLDSIQAEISRHPSSDALIYGPIVAVNLLDTARIRAAVHGARVEGDPVYQYLNMQDIAQLAGLRDLHREMVDSLRAALARAPAADTSTNSVEGALHMAFVLAAFGDSAAAGRLLARAEAGLGALNDVLRRGDAEENITELLMRLGRTSEVLERLPRQLSGTGPLTAAVLRIDPVYKPLWDDSRFEAILAAHPN
ncbi:MAG TPA: hypothetical protein VGI92_01835 [Gemmatimonadales bacterium]